MENRRQKLSPRHKANLFSRLVFWYLKSLLDRVRSDGLQASHLSFDAPSSERSELLGNKLETKWKKEVEDVAKADCGRPRLWRAIFRAFKWYFVQHLLQVVFLELIVSVVQPLLIVSSLDYYRFHSESIPISHVNSRGVCYAVLLLLQSSLTSHVRLQQRENGARLRSACASLIYRKITRLSCSSSSQITTKIISDILENEVKNFDKFFACIHNIWVTPLQVIVIACLMYNKVGASCLIGLLMLILQGVPIKLCSNRIAARFKSKVMSWTQERVSIISEVLRKIRETKIYCWEQLIEKTIHTSRRYEIDILKIASYAKGLRLASYVFSEYTSLFTVILVYTLLGYTEFEHEKVFFVVLYIYVLHESMIFTFPKAVTTIILANDSIKRIEQFLCLEEVEPYTSLSMLSNADSSILIKDVSASWLKNANVNLLENIDVCILPRKLFAISGPSAAGKTSFLKLILGELRPSSGEIFVNGSISYASQEPWFFPGTLRDNILCNEVYDELHYRQLMNTCGLDKVFEILPQGDDTVMLNEETTLTIEQQMKINLARALYREADIYLLDEVFTHLDDKVFEACMNSVLKDKTRIIIFQQDSPLLMLVDEIIIFEHGQIEFQGTYESYEQSIKFIEPRNKRVEPLLVKKAEVKHVTSLPLNTYHHQEKSKGTKLDETEELLTKSSTSDWLYWKYLKTGSSYRSLGFLLLICILAEASVRSADYWMGYWTNYSNKSQQTDYLLYVFLALVLGTIVTHVSKNIIFIKICLDSGEKIHNTMASRLLRTPMRFFYTHPFETILERFSKDIQQIDNKLPEAILEISHIFFGLLGASLFLAVINYWSIIPICVTSFLYYRLACLYASTIPKLRLLEQNASKKTLCHVESTMRGLPTIRNSRAQRLVLRGFSDTQNSRSCARNLVLCSIAGIKFWLDLLLTLLGLFVVCGFLALKNTSGLGSSESGIETLAGVALTLKQFMVITRMARLGLKASAKLEEQKAHLRRVDAYTDLEQEILSDNVAKEKLLKLWPNAGEIKFDHLYVRYCESDEPVLVNLDFTIEAGSNVLVIENTESQKSSLTSALYRLADVEGSLIIDSIDCIENLSLQKLRRTIAYITEESVFRPDSACLRDNIDPEREFNDDAIWEALKVTDLKRSFDSLEHSCCHLCSFKCKLLSLARAFLQKSKILVVNETTITDDDSNEVIQKILKNSFAHCTILTIAHKSHLPKLDCDKVVVVSEDGEATEYECKDDSVYDDKILS